MFKFPWQSILITFLVLAQISRPALTIPDKQLAPERAQFPGASAETPITGDLTQLYEETSKKLVSVHLMQRRPGKAVRLTSECTAFIISPEGEMLTSLGGIRRALQSDGSVSEDFVLMGGLNDESELVELKVSLLNASMDLALLEFGQPRKDLPHFELEAPAEISIGESIVVCGSALGRMEKGGLGVGSILSIAAEECNEYGLPRQIVRCSAQFPPDYAGGPVLDLKGHLLGMSFVTNGRKYADFSGYFYSARTLSYSLEQLRKKENWPRTALGLYFLDDKAARQRRLRYRLPYGLYVNEVSLDGAAYVGKLEKGDVITRMNGRSVTTLRQFTEALAQLKPGEELKLTVFREEQNSVKELTLYPEPYQPMLY